MSNLLSHSKVVRRRIVLLIGLIPILATWYYLACIVPIFGLGQLWLNLDRKSISMNNLGFGELVCDIQAETVRRKMSISGGDKRIYVVNRFKKQGEIFYRWKLDVVDNQSGQKRAEKFFDLRADVDPVIVGQRFVIYTESTNSLHVIDLESKDQRIESHSLQHAEKYRLHRIGLTGRFLVEYSNVDPASNSAANPMVYELHEFGPDGILHRLNSWHATRAATVGVYHSRWKDQLITIHPFDNTLETHSALDGQLISASPLPTDFVLGKDYFKFGGNYRRDGPPFSANYLSVNQWQKAFSLGDRRWIKIPDGCDGLFDTSPNGSLRLWEERSGNFGQPSSFIVTDGQSDEVVNRHQCVSRNRAVFLDDDTVVCLSRTWGYTFRSVSARSGELLKTWRPYWMVFPILLFSLPAYMIWCVAWLRSADPVDRWPWLDVALVSGLPIAAFILRMRMAGGTLDFERMPIAISQGIFVALIFSSSIWLWNSRKRLLLRLLPIMLVHACLANAIASVFPLQLTKGPTVLFPSLVLTGTLCIVCILLRFLGYRFIPSNEISEAKGWSISLRESLILIAALAILFASWQRLIGELRFIDRRLIDWRFYIVLTFVPPIPLLLSLSRNRYLHSLGKVMALLAFAYLLFDVLDQFVGWQDRYRGLQDGLIYVVLSAFISTFILGKAFRRRDWRLCRSQTAGNTPVNPKTNRALDFVQGSAKRL